ncbi:ArnT family glycosyltransferase [Cypionkella sp.]|uniref:ArnT family glycosyltransferase n=1 Tax=Cypionkella sp. TaxID=2811411 RepID=UPI002ABC39AF|nr:glycosyltransferase family 39 protein [Cypionkella sp.]MDZ4391637.1 glycosyltransferase family 39 protein [Cypionkella sp.]
MTDRTLTDRTLTEPEQTADWFRPALLIVTAITLLRWLLLAFDRTDLYVDESQYWLWGQEFAFGYYSKPPLIGWLIGAVTTLAGSDSPFWVRMPGAFLHGATALILGAWAARLYGARAAVLTAATYATVPFTALGSLLISTDTVMAPFFAAALYAHHRLAETRAPKFALWAGAAIGAAFMAKYAAIYFLIGVALAALRPQGRIGWRNAALLLLAFLVVISGNLIWNISHQFTTLSHTVDNVGWVRQDNPLAALNFASAAEFVLSQFAVAGPVIFAATLIAIRKLPIQAAFVIPPLLVVTVQALLGTAQANWAVAAYFAGIPLAIGLLQNRPRWLTASFAVNAVFCITLPLLTIFTWVQWQGAPLIERQLGRAAMSRQIIAIAHAQGNPPILADNRSVLADLFYTGQAEGVTIYAPRPKGRAQNHYEQRYPLPADLTGPLLWITKTAPACATATYALDATGGAYRKSGYVAYLVPAACANAQQ